MVDNVVVQSFNHPKIRHKEYLLFDIP